MRLLLVEDDRVSADYLVKALGESGHVVDPIADGAQGLERAKSETYDPFDR